MHLRWSRRADLPTCGKVTVTHGQLLKDVAQKELECMERAVGNGVGAELTYTFPTNEGDPIRVYYRATPTGRLEVYVDSTADNFGSRRWSYFRCEKASPIADWANCP